PVDGADAELRGLGPKNGGGTGSGVRAGLTWFHANVPEDRLGAALDVERDRWTALKPTAALLEEERASVLAEPIKREARAWNTLIGLAYGDYGLGRPILGTPSSV